MTPERAQDIVSAINARCFVTMGIDQELYSLEGVSLAEMIEAAAIVQAKNAAAEAHARAHGGGYSISMVPAHRLIAAVYVVEHYEPAREPILYLPRLGFFTDRVALALVAMDSREAEQDEEDEAP
ncbi:MAG: hypothetical protein AB1592_13315 [Pseudomonadota bacterium]